MSAYCSKMVPKRDRRHCKRVATLVGLFFALIAFSAECATPGAQGQVPQVTCNPETGETTGDATVTSTGSNFVLYCGAGGVKTTVPDKFDGTKVCKSEKMKSDFLRYSDECEEPVDFATLFPGSAGSPGWWQAKSVGSSNRKSWELVIPSESFPRYNQRFWVGCSNFLSNVERHCMVAVNVQADQATQDKNSVKCSFTKNESFAVELSKAQPEFTLDCGAGAVPVPSDFNSAYCGDPITNKGCVSKTYGGIFPNYPAQGLWSGGIATSGKATFKIQSGSFPSTKATFHVGCSGPSGTPGEDKFCTVAVTVDPTASGSGSQGGSGSGSQSGSDSSKSRTGGQPDGSSAGKSDGNWATPMTTVWILGTLVALVGGARVSL